MFRQKPTSDYLAEEAERRATYASQVNSRMSEWAQQVWADDTVPIPVLIMAIDARFQVLEMALAEAEEEIKSLKRAPECPSCFSTDPTVRGILPLATGGRWGYSESTCDDDWHD